MLQAWSTLGQVPPAVEEFLVDWAADAGRLGGSLGGGLSGPAASSGGAKGGARGAARAARWMRTVLASREGAVATPGDEALSRVRSNHPKAFELETDEGVVRLVVPVGRTGLQCAVVDIHYPLEWQAGDSVRLCAYGKEGLFNRHPTDKAAESVFRALNAATT
jgi:hypothetical protein